MLSMGPDNMSCNLSSEELNLEMPIIGKYLGIEINVKGRNLIKSREKKMISTARNYAQTIFGCTKLGLDSSVTAHRIW